MIAAKAVEQSPNPIVRALNFYPDNRMSGLKGAQWRRVAFVRYRATELPVSRGSEGVAYERPDLSVVIPAFNEESTVAQVVLDHASVCQGLGIGSEILVLDDGSTDTTASEVRRLEGLIPSLRLLSHGQNLGIGRSLLDLYRAARGQWIFFNAADAQVPASELAHMWAVRDDVELVVGRRTPRRDPAHRVAFATVYSALLRALFRVRVRDVHSVKLYRAEALRRAWPSSTSSFAEDEILIALHRASERVREIPIGHRPRRTGHAHGGSFRIATGAIIDLLAFALVGRVISEDARVRASRSDDPSADPP